MNPSESGWTGDGVRLRPFAAGDAPAVHTACQDPDIQRWTTVPVPYLPEHAAAFVAASLATWEQGRPSCAVVDAGTDELLGSLGVVDVSPEGDTEIGYWIAPAARGRGVATTALRLLAAQLFAVGVPRLVWHAEAGNVASRRVAERAGFVVEGTARRGMVHRGQRVDAWTGSMLPEDLTRTVAAPSLLPGWPVTGVTLRTDRLTLRPYRETDAPALLAHAQDSTVAMWDPEGLTDLASALERVRRRADWSSGRSASWMLTQPDDLDTPVGGISLHSIDPDQRCGEVGFGLSEAARGHGLATEATLVVTRWAFDVLGLRRVTLVHAVGNPRSCAVADRCGFTLEGTTRQSYRYGDGQWHDEHLHARVADDPDPAG